MKAFPATWLATQSAQSLCRNATTCSVPCCTLGTSRRGSKEMAQRIGLLLLMLCAQLVHAQITTPHPRLMLDSATLTTLRARAAANTSEWQQLKNYCDSFIGGTVNLPAV